MYVYTSPRKMNHTRVFVDIGQYVITCIIDAKGLFMIDALGTFNSSPYIKLSDHDIALRILEECRKQHTLIKTIKHSDYFTDVTKIMCKYKDAVRLIEDAALNPYTVYGRKRLEKEFFELII